jgi:AmmeMemoRadiSam system protein B
VAGVLYPSDPAELATAVGTLLADAPAESARPKAVIVPHGGLRHSGAIAAHAFRALLADPGATTRVVLAGPAHRSVFEGIALPEAEAFATPLGAVAVDAAATQSLLSLPWIRRTDAPHRCEHALEMQLPFLQLALDRFQIVPLLVGRASEELVGATLRRVWGGPETLVVVSTDLSQHRGYADAKRLDDDTAARIVRCAGGLDHDCACGGTIVDALLAIARVEALTPRQLDLANSGDTGGDVSRVVGYGAFGFYGPGAARSDT